MGIREIIERARQAQQRHQQQHPVQLEIPNPVVLWASEQEARQRFYDETFTPAEMKMAREFNLRTTGGDY